MSRKTGSLFPKQGIKMLKGRKKHIVKEQGKTIYEAPRSVNYRATQNKNNIGTTNSKLKIITSTYIYDLKNSSHQLWVIY